jgi:hypothetical protein
VPLGQVEGEGLLVDVGAVQVQQGDVAEALEGLRAEAAGELLGVVGEVLEQDALLVAVALHAAGVVEQAGLADEAEAVEAGQDEGDQRAEAR